jgi:cis-3-alkyl-4-acyloxetan-2-one decarboxylase
MLHSSPPSSSRSAADPLPEWLQAQVPFQRSLIRVGPFRMHVMEQGEGHPVLLLHGNPAWSFLWRKVALALKDAPLRLVMPDLIGLGFSDKPRAVEWHTLDNHAAQIAQLVEVLGLERFVFVGHDWGGPIGVAALTLLGAPRVSGIVLLNTLVAPPKPGSRGTKFHRFARTPIVSDIAFRLFGFPQSVMSRAQADPRSISGDVARAYRFPLSGLSRNAAPLALARMVPGSVEHPSVPLLVRGRDFLQAFTGPTEIVWGEADPILGRALRKVQETLPSARVTRVHAGHFLQEEAPAEIAEAIRRVASVSR